MGSWSQLPNDLWGAIGENLEGIDRIVFRSVCRTWRSCLPYPFPQPPWLMLAEDHDHPNTRGIFGLGKSQHQQDQHHQDEDKQSVYQLELPEVYQTRCVGSTGTWLITVDGVKERIRILNPFSRRQFHLPSPRTIKDGFMYITHTPEVIIRDFLLEKVVLSSPPSSPSCIAVAIHNPLNSLSFARPGDVSWTPLEVEIPRGFRGFFQDVIFYRNQFYAINKRKLLAVCDLNEAHPKAILISDYRKELDAPLEQLYYLVEWMGELLAVLKIMDDPRQNPDDPILSDPNAIFYKLDRFEVYKFDFHQREWNALDDLGEYSLFLGFSTSVAVLASNYPGLKKNCIYFTDDYTWGYHCRFPGGRSMGVFDLGDSSVKPHYQVSVEVEVELNVIRYGITYIDVEHRLDIDVRLSDSVAATQK